MALITGVEYPKGSMPMCGDHRGVLFSLQGQNRGLVELIRDIEDSAGRTLGPGRIYQIYMPTVDSIGWQYNEQIQFEELGDHFDEPCYNESGHRILATRKVPSYADADR